MGLSRQTCGRLRHPPCVVLWCAVVRFSHHCTPQHNTCERRRREQSSRMGSKHGLKSVRERASALLPLSLRVEELSFHSNGLGLALVAGECATPVSAMSRTAGDKHKAPTQAPPPPPVATRPQKTYLCKRSHRSSQSWRTDVLLLSLSFNMKSKQGQKRCRKRHFLHLFCPCLFQTEGREA